MLVSCSMIEELLRRIIRAFLVDEKEADKLLEGFGAPLGSFAARTKMAYSLGLISKREADECDRLRKIRNEFAHRVQCSFDNPKIAKLCEPLTLSVPGEKTSPKGRFTTSAVSLIVGWTNRAHYVGLERLTARSWRY